MLNGKAKVIFPNILAFGGDLVYEGQFVNDKEHGPGVYTWSDGKQYADVATL